MSINQWPDVLRRAGINVVVHPEVSRLSNGNLADCNIVWHHDASPPGDSPGALSWMKSNFSVASAQIWVDRAGTWHFISFGVAWHAGRVNDKAFDNYHSVGIETDHTTNEAWPAAQINSLRKGTAAVLRSEGKSSRNLSFHKTIAVPAGRKSDPDGLDLGSERNTVQALISGGSATSTPTPTEGDDDVLQEDRDRLFRIEQKLDEVRAIEINEDTANAKSSNAALADIQPRVHNLEAALKEQAALLAKIAASVGA